MDSFQVDGYSVIAPKSQLESEKSILINLKAMILILAFFSSVTYYCACFSYFYCLNTLANIYNLKEKRHLKTCFAIGLITVLTAILTGRQSEENL